MSVQITSENLKAMSPEDFAQLRFDVDREAERRAVLANAEANLAELNQSVLTAEGVCEGDAWRAPGGAHNAYAGGWEVTHLGKTWVSLISGNVWEPGTSGWRLKTGSGGCPEWVRPTGAHDAYGVGECASFGGVAYLSTLDGNVWSLEEHPSGWEKRD